MLSHTNQTTSKRYYWLKLKDDFFEREEIQIISSLPNGSDYLLLYINLMTKSINSDGRLVLKNLIPYNVQMISTITRCNADTVRSAIDIFIKFGLMSTLEDGTLYMNEVQALLGSETEFAAKKREYRQNRKNNPKQLPDKSKTKKDNVLDNVRQENRDKSLEYIPPNPQIENQTTDIGAGNISKLMEVIHKCNYSFSEQDLNSIQNWLSYITSKKGTLTDLQIEINLKLFKQRISEGYDLTEMINQSIAANMSKLMNPDSSCIKKHKAVSIAKHVRPYRFENHAYIVPESPKEKENLAHSICQWYAKCINPKNGKPMTQAESDLVQQHQRVFTAQTKNQFGAYVTYTSWYEYVLQNEVHTGVSLLDQPMATKPAVVDSCITRLVNSSRI
jgi:predicted phage replisome organizer